MGNSLVDMYAIYGRMDNAQRVFNKMPLCDVVSWNVYNQMTSLLFVFCQFVAMHVCWMKACAFMFQ